MLRPHASPQSALYGNVTPRYILGPSLNPHRTRLFRVSGGISARWEGMLMHRRTALFAAVTGLILVQSGCKLPLGFVGNGVPNDPFLAMHHDAEEYPCGQATVAEAEADAVEQHVAKLPSRPQESRE
jgi:hypothetical protein